MIRALCAALALLMTSVAANSQQGVKSEEIILGTIQDLSGPLASVSKQARAGMVLRVDELNEQGGIFGRRVRLIVEDAGYDPKRAVLAAEKLVNRDKVFAMVGHLGTAQNNAVMPLLFEKNVLNFFPMSGARDMYEPAHKLKLAFWPSYFDTTRDGVLTLIQEKRLSRACVLYQDDEAGHEILRGGEAALKAAGLSFIETTSFKRGATDFTTQVAKLRAAECDFVLLGTIIRETIGSVTTARRMGFNPVFMAASPAYNDLIPKLGGAAMNGLYAPMTQQIPYLDEASQPVRFWATKYKTKFGEDPSISSATGYFVMDAFIQTAGKAGRNLTTDTFVRAMESSVLPPDLFGSPAMTFSATKRLGSSDSRLSQIQEGVWRIVSGYARAADKPAGGASGKGK